MPPRTTDPKPERREDPGELMERHNAWVERNGLEIVTRRGAIIRHTPKAFAIIRGNEHKQPKGKTEDE